MHVFIIRRSPIGFIHFLFILIMRRFFVVANGVISGYAILSLPFSYVCIVRPYAVGPRLLLMIFDIVSLNPLSTWLTKNNLFSIFSISFDRYMSQEEV